VFVYVMGMLVGWMRQEGFAGVGRDVWGRCVCVRTGVFVGEGGVDGWVERVGGELQWGPFEALTLSPPCVVRASSRDADCTGRTEGMAPVWSTTHTLGQMQQHAPGGGFCSE